MSACLEVPGAGGEHGQLATAPLLLLLALTPPPLDISNAAPHLIGICYYPTDTCSSHYNLSCVISWKWLKRGTNTEFSYRDEQDARYPSVFFFLNPAGHRKDTGKPYRLDTGYQKSRISDLIRNRLVGRISSYGKTLFHSGFYEEQEKMITEKSLKHRFFTFFGIFLEKWIKKSIQPDTRPARYPVDPFTCMYTCKLRRYQLLIPVL